MVLAGNKAKHLSSVNHTTKTVYHHHHHHHHQTHLLLSWICPFDRVDCDLKGAGISTCIFQIQVPLGGSLCLWPKVMFMAGRSLYLVQN